MFFFHFPKMYPFTLEEPVKNHRRINTKSVFPTILSGAAIFSCILLVIRLSVNIQELKECVLNATVSLMQEQARNGHFLAPNCLEGTLHSELLHFQLCSAHYDRINNVRSLQSVSLFVENSLLRSFTGEECSNFISWLQLCVQEEAESCIVSNSPRKAPLLNSTCPLYSRFDTFTRLCLLRDRKISYLDINGFILSPSEITQLTLKVLSFYKN